MAKKKKVDNKRAGKPCHARLTIYGAAVMPPWRRAEIAQWLRGQAAMLIDDASNYSARFTARFLK